MMRVTMGARPAPDRKRERETLDGQQPAWSESENHHRVKLIYDNQQLHELARTIHQETVDENEYNAERLTELKASGRKTESYQYVQPYVTQKVNAYASNPATRIPLTPQDRANVIEAVINEILGYGPLEPLLDDDSISDILVNTYDKVYVERRGKGSLEALPYVRFTDNGHLKSTIDRIVNDVGRTIDENSPMVDARLDRIRDGRVVQRVRVNAIIAPLSIEGPVLSIRKFPQDHMTLQSLVRNATITQNIANLLDKICKAKLNVLISGGTGSGKTTLLNALSGAIPGQERIITIEDTAELNLQQSHVVRLETRPPNPNQQSGPITQRDLVRNSLRMRPDRIIVGEVRGDEALDMLQAMNTGHEGSLTTIHANNGRDALSRLETMVAMATGNTSSHFIRQSISRAFDVILHMSRLGDSRKLVSLIEITGMQDDIITMQEIFTFDQAGLENGLVQGSFKAKGITPEFIDRFRKRSIPFPDSDFDMFKAN